MKDKITFIIGASGGIGGAAARKILTEGGTVINGSRGECGIETVRNLHLDAEHPETIYDAVNTIIADYGRIDNFIYCAGDSMAAPFEHTTDEDARHIFEVNFFGFVSSLKKIVPLMREQGGGRIVAVSSMAGEFPIPFDPFYSASKAALTMLVKELCIELSPYGIFLTSVMPGGTATDFSFSRKIYSRDEAGVYADEMVKATDALEKIEQNGDSPELVAAQILDILKSKKPPLTSATGMKNKAMRTLKNIMPEQFAQGMNKNQFLR